MGIKYCKACKKPMKATDTHCKTCGAEYKNGIAVPLIILVVIIAIGGAIYALSSNDERCVIIDKHLLSLTKNEANCYQTALHFKGLE